MDKKFRTTIVMSASVFSCKYHDTMKVLNEYFNI